MRLKLNYALSKIGFKVRSKRRISRMRLKRAICRAWSRLYPAIKEKNLKNEIETEEDNLDYGGDIMIKEKNLKNEIETEDIRSFP